MEVENPIEELDIISDAPGILPFLPMLYVAWSDGVLTPTELDTIRNKLKQEEWLNPIEQKVLAGWLDPGAPPSVRQLHNWMKIIKNAASEISDSSKKSLVDLGLEIARIGARSESNRCTTPEACAALREVEKALGILSLEASRDLLAAATGSGHAGPAQERPGASFDVDQMGRLLDGKNAKIRSRVKNLLLDPVFQYDYGMHKRAYRQRVLSWCRELAKQGLGSLSYPKAQGGEGDLDSFMAAFETIALHDLSLAIKFGVQFGLFGGSILNLGTEYHHKKYLRAVGTLELPGCFAMTELGHGSNVRDIETTATFDQQSSEFIIHTPSESARKDYIGNAALHGQMATVFAQLHIEDDPYGVHAFLVPIRNKNGEPLPGIRLDDCGEKMGLNGVDNGRIWFDQVRISRENLLNRFAEVGKDGSYSSSIASASQRFFTMLGTLVGGRISISAATLSAAKSALTIAIRYATKRRQFGTPGTQETLLIDYPIHRRRLLPLLANVYAIDFAQTYLVERYVNRTENDSREVEVLAAGIKVFSTWNATETIQMCREACGGQGYLAENRFAALKADSEIFTTFEGDNTVLLQLVAKGLLTEFKHQFSDMKLLGLMKYVADQASTAIAELNPVITRLTDETHLRDTDFQTNAFRYREKRLLATVAWRLKNRIDEGMDSYQAFVECQGHLVTLALAHVERVVQEQFLKGVSQCSDHELAKVLKTLCHLFSLSRIERDRGWFLENGYIEGNKAKAIRNQVDQLCLELKDDAIHLVNAFGIPDQLLGAPIALEK